MSTKIFLLMDQDDAETVATGLGCDNNERVNMHPEGFEVVLEPHEVELLCVKLDFVGCVELAEAIRYAAWCELGETEWNRVRALWRLENAELLKTFAPKSAKPS